eukprot:TRINITY_DN749_c0_g1_i7.p1 TRINITY_DN749_c0_g1~~TRINITY_DN749_c0_g1_i7.p1  ORF type:complete len:392 (-),score=96.82 TRINITY_DN749_c0_g1_i7:699-1874(-)
MEQKQKSAEERRSKAVQEVVQRAVDTRIQVSKQDHEEPSVEPPVLVQYPDIDRHHLTSDRFVGCLIGGMVGDILGAAVEGWRIKEIADTYPDGLRDFVSCVHMGVEMLGKRYGMYTDDTNSTLALAHSLVTNKGLDPGHAAKSYGEFYITTEPRRGYPNSAQAVMRAVLAGKDHRETGTMIFPNGSYANGGAMRISPIGLACRNATDDELYEMVRLAIISSHIHPDAIDGAFIQAKSIALLLKTNVDQFDISDFLKIQLESCRSPAIRKKIEMVISALPRVEKGEISEIEVVKSLGDSFQIKAEDALAVSLFGFARYYSRPEQAIIYTASFGGDTDTLCQLVGCLVGSLHGSGWIPDRWWDNIENGPRGRNYAVYLAQQLAQLDLRSPLST